MASYHSPGLYIEMLCYENQQGCFMWLLIEVSALNLESLSQLNWNNLKNIS